MRKEIVNIVSYYAIKHGNSFKECWDSLYKQYNKITCRNVRLRMVKTKAKSILDVIEKDNDLATLKTLAKTMFVVA